MAKPLVAVLAAGRGERFGGGKLAADCAGKPLARWAVEAAQAAVSPGLVVAGPDGASFAAGWTVLTNPSPQDGLGSSLALAAQHALAVGAPSLLVLLADMPLVTPAYLTRLAGRAAPAATRYPEGHAGVPALLDRSLIEVAAGLSGDHGLGPLLRGVTLLDPPSGMLRDVDTPADLAEVERQLSAR
jgi:CTP:molybdopterin cytidylyltransferase MocA